MSDALTEALASDEARYRDPVVKSDVITPAAVGAGGEPIAEPVEEKTETKVEDGKAVETEAKTDPKPEDEAEKERGRKNREAESKRWARLTAQLGDKDRENQQVRSEVAELRAQLAKLQKPTAEGEQPQPPAPAPMTQADIDRMVEERAAQRIAAEKRASEEAAFTVECNRVYAAGQAEFGTDFEPAIQSMFGMAGSPQTATALIEAALETDNPQGVLFHLGRNPAEVSRLNDMRPTKIGAAVAKIAATLAQPSAPAPKPTASRAPAPLEPVQGAVRTDGGPLGPKNMADWIEWDAKQRKRK